MRRVRTWLAAVAIVAAGAGALAACGSNPRASGRSSSPHRTTTTASTSGTSTSTTSVPASTSTTAAAPGTGVPMCQTAGLHVAVSGSQGAAGTEEVTLSLTNVASSSCTIYGYPGMLLLRTDRAEIA